MAHTVYAVASGKGGVGKTATTVNLGAALAGAGHTVVIVDTDLGMANLGGFLGLDASGTTLHEVLAGDASLEEAIYEVAGRLAVVPSGITLEGFADVETAVLSDAIGALEDAFDYVILDLGAGLSHDTVLPLALADAVILVSTPRPLSIQDTAKTREITERIGGRVAGVVLTRAPAPGDLDLDSISDRLGLPVLAVIPEDEAVPESAAAGHPLLEHDPDSPAAAGYRGLAEIVVAESLEEAPVVPSVPERAPADAATASASAEAAEAGGEPPADAESTSAAEAESEPAAEAEDEAAPAAEAGAAEGKDKSAEEIAAAIEAAVAEQPDADESAGAAEQPSAEAADAERAPGGTAEEDGPVEPVEAAEADTEDDAEDDEPEEVISIEGPGNPRESDDDDESKGLFSRFLG